MPSIIRSAAIAAFAVFATAQAQFSNSTSPGAVNVPGWEYDGCFSVQTAAGSLVETSPFMTVERCLLDCSAYDFAQISGSNCYCSTSNSGTTQIADSQCRTRCPGNPAEACGGPLPGTKRQAALGVVSVYKRLHIVPVGVIYITVITNVYVDFNPIIGALTTITYCSTATLTGCGCVNPPKPTASLTTTIKTVYACHTCNPDVYTFTVPCGIEPGTVTVPTVTVPVTTIIACQTCPGKATTVTVTPCPGCAVTSTAVAPVVSAVVTAKPVFTGAAVNVKAGSGLLAGAMVVAALL